MGSLTGPVKSMVDSPDFHAVFKKKFNLSELGFWWIQPKAESAGKYTQKKFINQEYTLL